jgi:hypothetical protein
MNKFEIDAQECLDKHGGIYINHWSTDCDGCSAAGNNKFTSLEELDKWIEDKYEWADGPWGWDFTTPDNLIEIAPHGYWGM